MTALTMVIVVADSQATADMLRAFARSSKSRAKELSLALPAASLAVRAASRLACTARSARI